MPLQMNQRHISFNYKDLGYEKYAEKPEIQPDFG